MESVLAKKIIDIKPKRIIEDGSCFLKVMELLYQYYGYDISAYTLIGISQVLGTRYRPANFEKGVRPYLWKNTSAQIERALREKFNLYFTREHLANKEEAVTYIKNNICNGDPICIGVNSYHLPYCKDYHLNYGGIFNCYHMILINGFDSEKNVFYVVDPTFNIVDETIPMDDFILAWNDGTGIGNYSPYTYFKLHKKNNISGDTSDFEYLKSCYLEAVSENIREYNRTDSGMYNDEFVYFGQGGMRKMCEDMRCVVNNNNNNDFSISILEDFYNNIFHRVRWLRKSFYLFIKNDAKCVLKCNEDNVVNLGKLFDIWTRIGMKLLMIIKSKHYNRLPTIINEIEKILDDENTIINNLLKG